MGAVGLQGLIGEDEGGVELVLFREIIDDAGEEKKRAPAAVEAAFQDVEIVHAVLLPLIGIGHILQRGTVEVAAVLQSLGGILQGLVGIFQFIGTIGGPVSRLTILDRIGDGKPVAGEERLAGRVDIKVKKAEALLEVALAGIVGAAEEDVGPIGQQLIGIFLAVFQLHLASRIGSGIERVEGKQRGGHLRCEVEEQCGVVILFEIQFLVALIISFHEGLVKGYPYFLLFPVLGVGQQFLQNLLSIGQSVAALEDGTGLRKLLLLSREGCRQDENEEQKKQSVHAVCVF